MKFPPTAWSIVQATAQSLELDVADLLYGSAHRHARARASAWRTIRGEVDDQGRPRYSFGEIASWFAVSKASVVRALTETRNSSL